MSCPLIFWQHLMEKMKNRILIDTHLLLWMFLEPERFSDKAEHFIKNSKDNDFFFSYASSWEISIKYGLGKIKLPKPPELFVPEIVRRAGVLHRPVELEQVLSVHSLPLLHKDPFDRLLIAQAKSENMTVFTADKIFSRYAVKTIYLSDIS